MSIPAWHMLYSDFPSRQLKVPISGSKKALMKCTEDETKLITPDTLQNKLNIGMSNTENGRCFVRPSGTEDVVRIYAEGETPLDAHELVEIAVTAIQEYINDV